MKVTYIFFTCGNDDQGAQACLFKFLPNNLFVTIRERFGDFVLKVATQFYLVYKKVKKLIEPFCKLNAISYHLCNYTNFTNKPTLQVFTQQNAFENKICQINVYWTGWRRQSLFTREPFFQVPSLFGWDTMQKQHTQINVIKANFFKKFNPKIWLCKRVLDLTCQKGVVRSEKAELFTKIFLTDSISLFICCLFLLEASINKLKLEF